MQNDLLLDPQKFEIAEEDQDEKGAIYCERLIEKWTPQLESEMLKGFIRLYYDEMYEQWGPDDEEERILAGNRNAGGSFKTYGYRCCALCFGRRRICQKQNRYPVV